MREKNILVVYDQKGTIYFAGTGYPDPVGIPFLHVEIPEDKYFVGIDVSVTPHKPILEDIPKPEMQILKERIEELEAQNSAILEGINSTR